MTMIMAAIKKQHWLLFVLKLSNLAGIFPLGAYIPVYGYIYLSHLLHWCNKSKKYDRPKYLSIAMF
ncbi:hypothetical protein PBF_17819 [Cytobacillus firmus DS1]|uniref:Uncharacterized protein n=1 Tax=Cytobacillus firmus DS1 TaxID=1307436 RepID=W7KQM9_CYTFI|nr:hypothetical protein PBF_17819 [Cytobacillus firmus DS1]